MSFHNRRYKVELTNKTRKQLFMLHIVAIRCQLLFEFSMSDQNFVLPAQDGVLVGHMSYNVLREKE